MSSLISVSDLDRRRRYSLKTLRQLSQETGLQIGTLWNIFHGRCPDVRKILQVCKALGVPARRLDWESFAHSGTMDRQQTGHELIDDAPSGKCPPGRCVLSEKKMVIADDATDER